MITHLWMDKDTWMPLDTELYTADHELVQRKVVRELRVNQNSYVNDLWADDRRAVGSYIASDRREDSRHHISADTLVVDSTSAPRRFFAQIGYYKYPHRFRSYSAAPCGSRFLRYHPYP